MTSTSPYRIQAEQKFNIAALLLQQALPKEACLPLSGVTFPEFGKFDDVEAKTVELKRTLESIVQIRSTGNRNTEKTRNARSLVLSWFRASYPFASLFLSVAKQGSSVCLLKRSFLFILSRCRLLIHMGYSVLGYWP